jgi:hypothetical protein
MLRLLNSFVGVITQYHQEKLGPSIDKPQNIEQITSLPHEAMVTELTSYIYKATERNETRRPLLLYILNGIERLKSLIDSTDPIADAAVVLIKRQLVDLIVHLKNLLTVSHSTLQTISYNNKDIELHGFVRGVFSGYSLCTSGQIIESTVFPSLGLKPNANNDAIEKALCCIIDEHVKMVQSQCEVRLLKLKVHSLEATAMLPSQPSWAASAAPAPQKLRRPGQLSTHSIFSLPPGFEDFVMNLLAPPEDENPAGNYSPTREI